MPQTAKPPLQSPIDRGKPVILNAAKKTNLQQIDFGGGVKHGHQPDLRVRSLQTRCVAFMRSGGAWSRSESLRLSVPLAD